MSLFTYFGFLFTYFGFLYTWLPGNMVTFRYLRYGKANHRTLTFVYLFTYFGFLYTWPPGNMVTFRYLRDGKANHRTLTFMSLFKFGTAVNFVLNGLVRFGRRMFRYRIRSDGASYVFGF